MKTGVLIVLICLNTVWGFSQSTLDTLFKKLSGRSLNTADSLNIINAKIDTEITAVKGNDQRFPELMIVNATEVKKYYGLRITVNDKIYGGKVINQSGMTFLYLGANYPNQSLTVSVKSKALKKSIRNIINYDITASGKIIGNKDKPYIFIRNEDVKILANTKNIIIDNIITN